MHLRTLDMKTVLARKNHLGQLTPGVNDRTVDKVVMHINFKESRKAKQELLKTRQVRPSDTPGGWVELEIQRLTPRASSTAVIIPTLARVRRERRAAVRANPCSPVLGQHYGGLEAAPDTTTTRTLSDVENASQQTDDSEMLEPPRGLGLPL